ncbi:retrotransposon ORF1 [Tanacetum coccineum]
MEGCSSNLKIPCNIGHVHVEKAYIDLNSPLNIMTRMTYNWIMRRKLNPREEANGGISNFTGRIKGMHVFIGNFTYVVDFMIFENISSIIDPRLSQVVLGRPFIEISNMTHDLPEGVVRFTNEDDEVTYKMPHKIEQYNSLSNLEKEHTKSIYLKNNEDNRRGVNYVTSKILGFYKECLELGPEYVTGLDDEGEVTLYLITRNLEVLRKFHWMILGGRFNQLSHVSSPLLSKPGEYNTEFVSIFSEFSSVREVYRVSDYLSENSVVRDEAGVILTNEQNDFLFVDASRMEEIEELSANICLMARIQPADNTSDVGPSYDSAFISEDHGIIAHRTPPYTLQHNGVSKRRNRTLLDMVRSMMSQTTVLKSFWDYALETAARILNMVLTKKVEKTPYKVWHGQAPKLSYLKVWGYEALVKRDTFT